MCGKNDQIKKELKKLKKKIDKVSRLMESNGNVNSISHSHTLNGWSETCGIMIDFVKFG